MRCLRLRPLGLVLLFFVVSSGCGSGGSSGPDLGRIATLALRGTVDGYVYLTGGAITLSNSATLPPGGTAAAHARIQITGTTSSVQTDAAGHFTFADAPAGTRTLYVTPTSGSPVGINVTVIAAATITFATPGFTREQAIAAVKTEVAKSDAVSSVLIMATSQPVPAGVRIRPGLGDADGNPDPTLETTTSAPSWLFYVDRRFGLRFHHLVRYYLIDAGTGAITVKDATSWPQANGARLYADDASNLTSKDLVSAPASKKAVARYSIAPGAPTRYALTRCPPNHKTYSLLIQGDARNDFATDHQNAKQKLVPALTPAGDHESLEFTPPKSGTVDPLAIVRSEFDTICSLADERDSLFVFVSSHGTENGGVLLSAAPGEDGTGDATKSLVLHGLPWENFRGYRIVIVIECCYSGQIREKLDKYFTDNDGKFLGKCITVIASSGVREASLSYKDGDQPGSVFMNQLTSAIGANGGQLTEENTDAVFTSAKQTTLTITKDEKTSYDDTDLPGQHSRIYRRPTTTEDAVELDYSLGSDFVAGQCIALRRITDGHVANPDVCGAPHFHCNSNKRITIDGKYGPYADPSPTGCGFGKITTIKK